MPKKTIERKLGDLIHDRRVEQQLRIIDLAEKTSVSVHTISNLERGRKKSTIDTYENLCAALNITTNDICAAIGQKCEETAVNTDITILNAQSVVLLQTALEKGNDAAFAKTAELYRAATGNNSFTKDLITYFWENKKVAQIEFSPNEIEQETIFLTYLKGGALHYYADICTYFNYLLAAQALPAEEIAKQVDIPTTAMKPLMDPSPSLERRFFITHIIKLNNVLGQGEFLPMVFNAQQLRRRIHLDPFISSIIVLYRKLQQKEPSEARAWLESLLPIINYF